MTNDEKLIEARKSPQVKAADQMREQPSLTNSLDLQEYFDRTDTTLKELKELFKTFNRQAINLEFRESGIVPKSPADAGTRNEAKRLHDQLLSHQQAIKAQSANPIPVVIAPNSPPGSSTGLPSGPVKTPLRKKR